MKVLLVSTNRERTPYPVVPVGPCLVAAQLEREEIESRVVDLMWTEDPGEPLARAVADFRPDFIGISMRNVDNSDLIETKYFVPEIRSIFSRLRRLTGVPLILGGAGAAIDPVRTFEEISPDAILYGDAERRFPDLLRRWAAGIPFDDLPGLVARRHGRIVHNALHSSEPIDGLPDPELFRYLDMKTYMRRDGVFPIQTKRGCGFTCTYCTYGTLEGLRYRFRPVPEVVEEIAYAHSHGAKFFEFVDAVFSHPPVHARAILNAILDRGLKVRLTAAGFNPVGVTEELVALMKKAGFVATTCTVESASDLVLKRMRKGFDRAAVQRIARWLPRHGIPAVWVFLVGSPGEDPDTVAETFDFIDREIPGSDLVYITNGVRVYPRTGLEAMLRADGLIPPEANLLEPFFYFSPDLPRAWYLDELARFGRQHRNVVNSFEAQQPIVERLARWFMYLPLPRPRWRVLPRLRRLVDPFQGIRPRVFEDHPYPIVPAAETR
ncbi:MAG: B12-binding domain-containing radical SAM protein [Thermoanaerobaculia bacterium]